MVVDFASLDRVDHEVNQNEAIAPLTIARRGSFPHAIQSPWNPYDTRTRLV